MQQIRTVTVAIPDRLDHQTRPLAPRNDATVTRMARAFDPHALCTDFK